ncbi:hypothetical protein J1605_014206 [Eschrichtius robustus]|uniref:Uncharacterized protein n=1 Tax=Eschrichtius robustus TaxID=9764 RepID=A0AB34GEM5_ESCRO|nr:hypothetical protein J1605_014206 [Eschrichtius robustus]
MSSGSSCSQTPSRAIPATRRVVLGDGVHLPPGDYSSTPGGTLFSTTPGGRHGLGGRRAPAPGAGGVENGLGRAGGLGNRQLDVATGLRGAATGKSGYGASGRRALFPSRGTPSFGLRVLACSSSASATRVADRPITRVVLSEGTWGRGQRCAEKHVLLSGGKGGNRVSSLRMDEEEEAELARQPGFGYTLQRSPCLPSPAQHSHLNILDFLEYWQDELAGPDVKGSLGGSVLFCFSTKILSRTGRLCLPNRLPIKNSRPGKGGEGEPCGPARPRLCLPVVGAPVVGAPPVSRL